MQNGIVDVQNNGKEKYKKVCCMCKLVSLLLTRSIDFAVVLIAVAVQHYTILFFLFISIKLARSSLLALAKSIYYSSSNILFQVFTHHILHFLLKMYRLFSVFWTVNIYILLDGLVCSIVGYCYESRCILANR